MAEPEPAFPDRDRATLAWRRYWRLMRWMVVVAVIAVVLALLYLGAGAGPLPIHMVIATVAGVGFSVLLGAGLMLLSFLSAGSGHDEDAGARRGDGE